MFFGFVANVKIVVSNRTKDEFYSLLFCPRFITIHRAVCHDPRIPIDLFHM